MFAVIPIKAKLILKYFKHQTGLKLKYESINTSKLVV